MKLFSFVVGCLLLAAAAVEAQGLSGGTYSNKSNGPFIDTSYLRPPEINGQGKGALSESLKGQMLTGLAPKGGPSPVITASDYSLSKPVEFRLPCRYPRFIKEPTRQFPSADPSKNMSRLNDLPYLRLQQDMSRKGTMEDETIMHKLYDRYGMGHHYCW